jgi:hypothetical protein
VAMNSVIFSMLSRCLRIMDVISAISLVMPYSRLAWSAAKFPSASAIDFCIC